MMLALAGSARHLTAHMLAGVTGLVFAYVVSESSYVTSGLQFVAPLALIFAAHLGWMGITRSLTPGYAGIAISRTLLTSIGLVAASLFAAVTAPMPASANADQWIGQALVVLLCLFMVAVVLGTVGFVIYAVYKLAVRAARARKGGPPDAGVNDFGAVVLVLAFIGAASLEGVAGFYSFASQDQASSTRLARGRYGDIAGVSAAGSVENSAAAGCHYRRRRGRLGRAPCGPFPWAGRGRRPRAAGDAADQRRGGVFSA
jgi:hypothetical protein